MLAYVEAENEYFEAVMAPRQPLIDRLYEEMKGRIKEDESSVPQKDGDWIYWTGFETGGQYRKWWRKPVAGGADELLLDEPALAEGKEYFRLGAFSISNNGRYLAYAIDDNGSERFEVRVKDLTTGEHLPDVIPGMLSRSSGSPTIAAFSMAWRMRSGAPTMRGSTGWARRSLRMSSCSTRMTRVTASPSPRPRRATGS